MRTGNAVYKKEYQERKEEKERKKHVCNLGEWVDSRSDSFQEARQKANALFNAHLAGIKRGTDPALIKRFVAGYLLGIPCVDFENLQIELKEAEAKYLDYESYRGFGQRTGIRKPFVHIAAYLRKCFEKDGWEWEECHSPLEVRLKKAHAKRASNPTPFLPGLEEKHAPSLPDVFDHSSPGA